MVLLCLELVPTTTTSDGEALYNLDQIFCSVEGIDHNLQFLLEANDCLHHGQLTVEGVGLVYSHFGLRHPSPRAQAAEVLDIDPQGMEYPEEVLDTVVDSQETEDCGGLVLHLSEEFAPPSQEQISPPKTSKKRAKKEERELVLVCSCNTEISTTESLRSHHKHCKKNRGRPFEDLLWDCIVTLFATTRIDGRMHVNKLAGEELLRETPYVGSTVCNPTTPPPRNALEILTFPYRKLTEPAKQALASLRKLEKEHSFLKVLGEVASHEKLAGPLLEWLFSLPELRDLLSDETPLFHRTLGTKFKISALNMAALRDQILLTDHSYNALYRAVHANQPCALPSLHGTNSWRAVNNELVRRIFRLSLLPGDHVGCRANIRPIVAGWCYLMAESPLGGYESLPDDLPFKVSADGRIFHRQTSDLPRGSPSVTATVSPLGDRFASQAVSNVFPFFVLLAEEDPLSLEHLLLTLKEQLPGLNALVLEVAGKPNKTVRLRPLHVYDFKMLWDLLRAASWMMEKDQASALRQPAPAPPSDAHPRKKLLCLDCTASWDERQHYEKYSSDGEVRRSWPPGLDPYLPFKPSHCFNDEMHLEMRDTERDIVLTGHHCGVLEKENVRTVQESLLAINTFLAKHFSMFRIALVDRNSVSDSLDQALYFKAVNSVQDCEVVSFWDDFRNFVSVVFPSSIPERCENLLRSKNLLLVAFHHKRLLYAKARLPRLLSNEEIRQIEIHGEVIHYLYTELYVQWSAFYPHLSTCCLKKQIRRCQDLFGVSWGSLRNQAVEQKHRDDAQLLGRHCQVASPSFKKESVFSNPTPSILQLPSEETIVSERTIETVVREVTVSGDVRAVTTTKTHNGAEQLMLSTLRPLVTHLVYNKELYPASPTYNLRGLKFQLPPAKPTHTTEAATATNDMTNSVPLQKKQKKNHMSPDGLNIVDELVPDALLDTKLTEKFNTTEYRYFVLSAKGKK